MSQRICSFVRLVTLLQLHILFWDTLDKMVKWILWYSLLITQVILWLKVCLAASAVTILTDHCVCSLIFQSWVGCQREQTTVPQLTQKLVQIVWNTNSNMNLKVSEPKFMNIICCLFGNKDKRIIIQCKKT